MYVRGLVEETEQLQSLPQHAGRGVPLSLICCGQSGGHNRQRSARFVPPVQPKDPLSANQTPFPVWASGSNARYMTRIGSAAAWTMFPSSTVVPGGSGQPLPGPVCE